MREGGREEGMRGEHKRLERGGMNRGERQREKRYEETKIEKRDNGGSEGGRGKGHGLGRDKTTDRWVREHVGQPIRPTLGCSLRDFHSLHTVLQLSMTPDPGRGLDGHVRIMTCTCT